jgi:hypothetical protein
MSDEPQTDETDGTEPPGDGLPEAVIDAVDELSEQQLRKLISYTRERIASTYEPVIESIEASDNETILRKAQREGYVEVVKTRTCRDGCAECPHGPYLYHVRRERQLDGETTLRWDYIGRADE